MKNVLTYISFVLLISSCIPAKKVKYLQDNQQETKNSFVAKKTEYKLMSGDNIMILLSSPDPEIDKILNGQIVTTSQQGVSQKYRDIYLIDKTGHIEHKQFEPMYIEGLTLEETKEKIKKAIGLYYKNVNVDVRLADSYVVILGEVNAPGRYLIDYDDKISVFTLLGMAGDLTLAANKNRIKVIREVDGKTSINYIDITQKDILTNEFYYLMPNDIVYVEPLDAVFVQPKYFPILTTLTMLISTTTSIIVLYQFFK